MKIFILIGILFGIVACSPKPTYEVKIKLTGAEGKVYLSQRQKGKWIRLDSTTLASGEGIMKGFVEIPEVYYVELSSPRNDFPLFVENSTISVIGAVDSLRKVKVTGSKVHSEYQILKNKLDVVEKQANDLFQEAQKAKESGKTGKADSLTALGQNIYLEVDKMQRNYVKTNPASYISPFVLSQVSYVIEGDVLDGFLSGLDKKLDSVQIIMSLKDRAVKLKRISIGQIAPDFTMNSVDGNPIKLSDVYSKSEYTLIDFWASWCGPCRGENPNVLAVFNDYKAKGFGILGVSLDNNKANWEKAIADDKLTWLHVSDLKGWQNEAATLYAINLVPSNLLVDRTGKIVGRNLREEKLRETISGLLK